ncbi:50S ribosomal protein L17 [Desulfohalovibrio reitneri]|uniref:50S ribosomal protein L17 n=1 Tax=Desulfohalovibrio reitneri TaxID=1307759 RepID=UPI0004A6B484|nr:50S ribosomal protein L17 [Desulfohalovibrio reitneri]
MRHRRAGKKFGMKPSHRKSMFRSMARSLLTHERIRTTETKAKELRRVVDNLVTLALRNDLHARRQAYKVLENHQLVQKLFDEIGPRFQGVPGGFTRVVKLGDPRRGDNAPMAVIELSVQAGQEAPTPTPKKKAKEESKPAAAKAEPKAEEPASEEPAAGETVAEAEEAPAEETSTEEAPVEEAPAGEEKKAE